MVAAGAGSGERVCGGDGGSLIGYSSDQDYIAYNNHANRTTGGTQTSGGIFGCETLLKGCGISGRFGIGGSGNNEKDHGPSGGGGYYGGGGVIWAGSAGGGSSFISGYEGCDAIYENSTENHIYHTGRPLHYSGKYFTDAIMIDGQSSMPSTDLKRYEIGHTGDGYALITYIGSNLIYSCLINTYFLNYFLLSNFYILIS
ncbi:glycine-rich cell wall structural protein, putative [Trichomonas vaginalis G3]|uniref:receptor protein-tyrosine kinase n=1 Tax=Trichomonas vaginalis (strain ATCC PRA-98 / G3) TaxID=412133 RepID=A2EM85_TRIV3|nr:glycine-rich cell wall structural protein, putative [Trichomonas vaginalis G3]|eukprot:XP_001318420.1 glycine-rich cell wall structural protein [Trichomonas vaginalis G3]